MDKQIDVPNHVGREKRRMNGGGVSDGLYGLSFIGALVYYLQHETSLGQG